LEGCFIFLSFFFCKGLLKSSLKLFGCSALGGGYPSRSDELDIICQLEEGKFPFPVVLDKFLTFMGKTPNFEILLVFGKNI